MSKNGKKCEKVRFFAHKNRPLRHQDTKKSIIHHEGREGKLDRSQNSEENNSHEKAQRKEARSQESEFRRKKTTAPIYGSPNWCWAGQARGENGLTGSGKRFIILCGDVSVKVFENCRFGFKGN